jgi:CrcB protein
VGPAGLAMRRGKPWLTPPTATFAINVTGCALIGVLMVAVTEVWEAPPLVRPFVGIGVLGGYTTFSTCIVDIQKSLTAGFPLTAIAYLLITLFAALFAVYAGATLTRLATRRREHEDRS